MDKIYRVEIDFNLNVSYDHCLYVGTSFKEALKYYRLAKKEFKEGMLITYKGFKTDNFDYIDDEFVNGNYNEIYCFSK